jgi:hypothetical protein
LKNIKVLYSHFNAFIILSALRTGNDELADHIHIGLMVDHVSLCSPWMVGVKQLIHHIKSQAMKQEEMFSN